MDAGSHGLLKFVGLAIVIGWFATIEFAHAQSSSLAQQSVESSIEFLRQRMDEFHSRFPVYDDVSSAGNHFSAFAKIPNGTVPVTVNGSWAISPQSGATSIRFTFAPRHASDFGGFYLLNGVLPSGARAPVPNFGEQSNAGLNLGSAMRLTFYARGEQGGEVVEFFIGGVGRDPATGVPQAPFPDSTPVKRIIVTLTAQWQQYSIDVSGLDLTYVLGGFGWVANAPSNPTGVAFYVDDVGYELSPGARDLRLDQPRLLRSFVTLPVQPDVSDANNEDDIDFVLRNTAFTYDNALAVLAFIAHGSADSLRRARLIGDAFVYASEHDRFYTDGRLRSAYAAGDISLPPGWTPNGRTATVPVSGFFDEAKQEFIEVEQTAVDTGNNAWAMIALLALYQKTNVPQYLDTARKIGVFIRTFRNDLGVYKGFQGGIENPEEQAPILRIYASVEHNLDIFAAFSLMAQITGEPDWQAHADHAMEFVAAMFDAGPGCYLAGTIDPNTRNSVAGQLPVDVQAWSILSLRNVIASQFGLLLACAETNHRVARDGFSGYDFNDDKDGVWFEGSAHVAVAYALAGRAAEADALRATLQQAQNVAAFGGGQALPAASHDAVSTGFNFKLFNRKHVGATAWNVFAQLGFNPYYDRQAPPAAVVPPAPPVQAADGSGNGCFIATAVYGSYLHPDVQVLREFRDRVLLRVPWGATVVDSYYRASPPVADAIARHPELKLAAWLALTPVIYAIKYPGLAFALIILMIGARICRRARRRRVGSIMQGNTQER